MANKYFRYFDIGIAEAITLSGQMAIKWYEKAINDSINSQLGTDKDYVVAMDTDSIMVDCSWIPELYKSSNGRESLSLEETIDILDRFGQNIFQNKVLNTASKDLMAMTQGRESRMEMKREVISDSSIWTAKKRYVMRIWDKEGVRYKEPHLKITGLEAIKSSTPKVCRAKLKELFHILVEGDEEKTREFILTFKKEFFLLSPGEIAFPRSVNGLEKYRNPDVNAKVPYMRVGTGGVPINVRASLTYNKMLEKKGLDKKYFLIKNGNKIRYLYLKLPNPTGENAIAFPRFLPKELDLDRYVDYNLQFEKTFLKPLSYIFSSLGWSMEKRSKLTKFFQSAAQ